MIIDVLTIFPDMFASVIQETMIKRAQEKGLLKINIHDLRAYSNDPHKKVDAPSYGGGAGMVFKAEPVFCAVEDVLGHTVYPRKEKDPAKCVVLLSPKGKTLTQGSLKRFLDYERLVLIAPRYEGVDERIREHLIDEEVSLGDYVLSGGELPAMVFIDCIARLIPGVVSDVESIIKESFEGDLLDYPVYTRPEDFRGLKVPEVLLSGDHVRIDQWRKAQSERITQEKRPDLWRKRKASGKKSNET
ncbi:MAG: tRNA (guanosine(37)-N1)-methyltransferase TrmD [Candidatus Omnitrophica bacterium]|nr:tRNA (guanosine(37)-N1)-methyltransferase TrmD [Candidatus Omnitrophota bacterium]